MSEKLKVETDRPVYSVFKGAKVEIEKGNCPTCGKPINQEDFRDDLSKREFEISGMCQVCQDQYFD